MNSWDGINQDNLVQPRKKKDSSGGKIFLIFLVIAVIVIVALFSTVFQKSLSEKDTEISALSGQVQSLESRIATLEKDLTSMETGETVVSYTDVSSDITAAAEKVGPAVVTVTASVPGTMTFFGQSGDSTSMGSGVIISEDGYIITNNHVIEDSYEVSVELADGTVLPAKLISSDEFSDLAVLKAEGEMPAVAKLGESEELKTGETVLAIGSPLGNFKNTVTVGVISATGRYLESENGYQMENLIQTDAAINQGNSGGPLVNLAGEVIGINVMIVRGSGYTSTTAEGLGFAIPADTVRLISNQIIATGEFSRPILGIRWADITPRMAQSYRLPVDYGVYLLGVTRDGPADAAGLKTDDIIVRIGDYSIEENSSFYNCLFKYSPGDQVEVGYYRNGDLKTTTVMLGGNTTESSVGL